MKEVKDRWMVVPGIWLKLQREYGRKGKIQTSSTTEEDGRREM